VRWLASEKGKPPPRAERHELFPRALLSSAIPILKLSSLARLGYELMNYTAAGSCDGFPINPLQIFRLMQERKPVQNRVARSNPNIAVRFVARKYSNGKSQFFLVVRSYEKAI
jgi:hypothetical protein